MKAQWRGKGKDMFNLVLTYECDCCQASLDPIKKAFLSGMEMADVHERFDDWMALETAIIELAKDSGWDLDEAMNSDWVEEQMNNCLHFDGEMTASISNYLCNEAYYYVTEHLDEINTRIETINVLTTGVGSEISARIGEAK